MTVIPLKTFPTYSPEMLSTLLMGIARRDRDSFSGLYKATNLKLYGVVLRILKRKQTAEDVLQEVYIKIWERAGEYNPSRGSPMAWMATIARNRAVDELRRLYASLSSDDVAEFENLASTAPLASALLEQSEESRRLLSCLNRLEEDKRNMIILAYTDGLSRETLAKQYNQNVATVKTWLRRGLENLKQCLAND